MIDIRMIGTVDYVRVGLPAEGTPREFVTVTLCDRNGASLDLKVDRLTAEALTSALRVRLDGNGS